MAAHPRRAKSKLPVDQWILDVLYDAYGNGAIPSEQIAESLGVSPRAVGNHLTTLTRRGWVHCYTTTDRNCNRWALTEAGVDMLVEL
jgi:predicted ArsR family transcriptional regulator